MTAHPSAASTGAGASAVHSPNRGQRPGAGQHRGDRDAEHAGQRMPAAAVVAWVGALGEVVERAAALRAGQRGGRGRMSGGRDGR